MELNLKIGRSLLYHDPVLFGKSRTEKVGILVSVWKIVRRASIIALCASFSAIISADPIIKVLQSLMTFLTFSKFVEKDGILHESTEACDQALTSAPMIDSYLALLASLFFWWLLFPTIYCLAKVVTPYGDKIPNRYMPRKYRSDLDASGSNTSSTTVASDGVEDTTKADGDESDVSTTRVSVFREQEERSDYKWLGSIISVKDPKLEFTLMGKRQMYSDKWDYHVTGVNDSGDESDIQKLEVMKDNKVCELIHSGDLVNIQGYADYFKVVFRSKYHFISSKFYFFLKLFSFVSIDLISTEICLWWLRCLTVVFETENFERGTSDLEELSAQMSQITSVILEQFKVKYSGDLYEWERSEWRRRHHNALPKYLSLCREVCRELVDRLCFLFKIKPNEKILIALVEYIVFIFSYIFPVGHILTEIGIVYWFVVVEKLFIFFLQNSRRR